MRTLFHYILCLIFISSVHAQSQRAEQLIEEIITADSDTFRISKIVSLCLELQDLGEYGKALRYANEALVQSKKLNFEKGMADAYNRIAEIYRLQGNYPRAMENHFSALRSSEKANYKRGMARAYKNSGMVYFNQGDYKNALRNFSKGRELFSELNYQKGIADCLHNIAMVHNADGDLENALVNYRNVIKIKKEIEDKTGIAAALIDIGTVYTKKEAKEGNAAFGDTALQNYIEGSELSKEIGYKTGIVSSSIFIGRAYHDKGKYKEAGNYLDKALEMATEIGNRELVKNAYSELTLLNEKQNDFKAAHESFKKFIAYRDQLINEENTRKNIGLELQYTFDKKEAILKAEQEKKDIISQQELRQQKVIRNSLLAGFSLLLVLAVVILKGYREKKRANKLLEDKNLLIENQKAMVEQKQKEVLASIQYAKRIQQSLLPQEKYIRKSLDKLK